MDEKFNKLIDALIAWGVDYEYSGTKNSQDVMFLLPNDIGLDLVVYFSSTDGIGAYIAD